MYTLRNSAEKSGRALQRKRTLAWCMPAAGLLIPVHLCFQRVFQEHPTPIFFLKPLLRWWTVIQSLPAMLN